MKSFITADDIAVAESFGVTRLRTAEFGAYPALSFDFEGAGYMLEVDDDVWMLTRDDHSDSCAFEYTSNVVSMRYEILGFDSDIRIPQRVLAYFAAMQKHAQATDVFRVVLGGMF